MDKRIEVFAKELCETVGFTKVMEVCDNLRKKMEAGYLKEYWYIYKHCYFYVQPIDKDSSVMRGIILERYTRNRIDVYYRFLGEDGLIHNDEDDSVMGEEKEKIEIYLNEIREDMIAGGEL